MKKFQKSGVLTLVATTAFILSGCGTQPVEDAVNDSVDAVASTVDQASDAGESVANTAMSTVSETSDAVADVAGGAAAVADDVRGAVAALGSDAPDSNRTQEETLRRFNDAREKAQAEAGRLMADSGEQLAAIGTEVGNAAKAAVDAGLERGPEIADRAAAEARDAAAAVADVIGTRAPKAADAVNNAASGLTNRASGAVNNLISATQPGGASATPGAPSGNDLQAAQRAAQDAAEQRRAAKRAAADARRQAAAGGAPATTSAPAAIAAPVVESVKDAASSVIDSAAGEAADVVASIAAAPQVNRQDSGERMSDIRIEPRVLEFGEIALGEAREGTVRLINTSDKPYTLIDCRASCGCTTTVCPKGETIEPGDFIEVSIQLDAGEKPTTLNKTVTFLVSDGHPPLRLALRAQAIAFVTASPESLARTESETARIELKSIDGKPFTVQSMFPAVLSQEELASEPAPTQLLEFTWDQLIAAGGRSRRLLIRVDHPETTRVLVPLSAEILREMRGVAVARGEAARIEPADAPTRDLNALLSANETDTVLEMIDNDEVEVSVKDRSGHTPMIKAARFGNVEVLSALVDKGGDLEATDGMGRTSLSYAAQSRNLEAVNLLIESGANIHHIDQTGNTPLGWAAGFGTAGMVKALLESGARVDTGSGGLIGFTPLIWAASVGTDPEKVELLINAGADVEARDTMEKATVVLHAIRTNKMKHVELLVNAGARLDRIDAKGHTALHVAARNAAPDVNMIRFLLSKGLDANTRTTPTTTAPEGETALELAQKRKDPRANGVINALKPVTRDDAADG
ncbi:MAG: ankyrin repeat domain-containing protein [Phycisphaerales bacterium]